jgi:hypothetical protein
VFFTESCPAHKNKSNIEISTEDAGVTLLSIREDRGNQGGSESLSLHKAVNESIRTLHIYCAVCVIFGTCGLQVLLLLGFCEFSDNRRRAGQAVFLWA